MRCRTMKLWALATLALSMIAFDDRSSVRAEFYVGEYKTVAAPSRGGGRDAVDADNEIVQSRQLKVDNHQHTKRRGPDGRSLGWSTFRPLTPGGTIYLAFVFLVPLTLGKTARRRSGWRWPAEWAERLLERVRVEQQSLYDEMGYVDGNLMVRRALYELRDSFVDRLNPWRRGKKVKKKRKKWKW